MLSNTLNNRAPRLLPTAVGAHQWERISAQSGGLLDWALDEMEMLLDDASPLAHPFVLPHCPPLAPAPLASAATPLLLFRASFKVSTNEGVRHLPSSESSDASGDEGVGEGSSDSASAPLRARGAPVHVHIRGKLTSHHAVAIFLVKLRPKQGPKAAEKLAAEFGVTAKAIRDVWARKSWGIQTRPYWEFTGLDAMPLATLGSASSEARVASALCGAAPHY